MKKIGFLFGIHLLSFFHKLRHDFVRELVVGFCSLIVLSLFYYVFNDFLNHEVRALSLTMRERFAETLTWVLIGACVFASGKMIRNFFLRSHSLYKTAKLLGEEPKIQKLFAVFHILGLLVCVFAPMWVFVDKVLVTWDLNRILKISFAMIVLSLAISFLKERSSSEAKFSFPILSSHLAMVFWRLNQMFLRNRITQFCFVLCVLCSLILILLAVFSLPFVGVFVLCFWSGCLGAFALCFQFAEDLSASYVEKSSGVSHRQYLTMLFSVSLCVGWGLGFGSGLIWYLTKSFMSGFELSNFLEAMRLCVITATPASVVPAVLFQIDGRRSVLTILTSFLVGLFLATAVYASWFSLVLFPFLIYYGFTTQEGRFYRA